MKLNKQSDAYLLLLFCVSINLLIILAYVYCFSYTMQITVFGQFFLIEFKLIDINYAYHLYIQQICTKLVEILHFWNNNTFFYQPFLWYLQKNATEIQLSNEFIPNVKATKVWLLILWLVFYLSVKTTRIGNKTHVETRRAQEMVNAF